jgi:hypothetical protein
MVKTIPFISNISIAQGLPSITIRGVVHKNETGFANHFNGFKYNFEDCRDAHLHCKIRN